MLPEIGGVCSKDERQPGVQELINPPMMSMDEDIHDGNLHLVNVCSGKGCFGD